MNTPVPRPDERPELRLSDADRDKAADFLRHHLGEGRLSLAETEDRLERVYSATVRGDLAGLFDDLPPVRSRRHSGRPDDRGSRRRRGGKGVPEHLRSYVLVNALLVTIWLMTGADGHFWPIWSIVFWGFALVMHASAVRNR